MADLIAHLIYIIYLLYIFCPVQWERDIKNRSRQRRLGGVMSIISWTSNLSYGGWGDRDRGDRGDRGDRSINRFRRPGQNWRQN